MTESFQDIRPRFPKFKQRFPNIRMGPPKLDYSGTDWRMLFPTLGNGFLNLGNGFVIFKNGFGIHKTLFGRLWRVDPNKSQPGVMSENVSEMSARTSVILENECGLPVCSRMERF
jgi:hypothetical protein